MGSDVEVTAADREKAREFAVDIETAPTPEYRDDVERDIAQALADERAKARAQVAWDLRDLVNDSGGDVWARAVLDFADSLDGVRET